MRIFQNIITGHNVCLAHWRTGVRTHHLDAPAGLGDRLDAEAEARRAVGVDGALLGREGGGEEEGRLAARVECVQW